MVLGGGGAFSHERGTPVSFFKQPIPPELVVLVVIRGIFPLDERKPVWIGVVCNLEIVLVLPLLLVF